MEPIEMDVAVTFETFEEDAYLAANPDVNAAVAAGSCPSGRAHFEQAGWREGRRIRRRGPVVEMRRAKIDRIRPFLRFDLPFTVDAGSGGKINYLTAALREETKIVDTSNISSWPYTADIKAIIDEFKGGLILDCGAGLRPVYYENVINYEIVDYDTTDILGVGEYLPFLDNTFDAVLSLVVLEHVRDPIKCASEIARVLKPGGKLLCTMPFLCPLHGFPHHYFNATHQGLRRLFEDRLEIDRISVPDGLHPIFALQWIINSWANGLSGDTRQQFIDLRIGDLLAEPTTFLDKAFVRALPEAQLFELAFGNMIEARKKPV